MNKIKNGISKLIKKIESFYSKNTKKRVWITFAIIAIIYVFSEVTGFPHNLVNNSYDYNYSENTNTTSENYNKEIQESMARDAEKYRESDTYKRQQKIDSIYQNEYCEDLAYVEKITEAMIESIYDEENSEYYVNILKSEGLEQHGYQYTKVKDFKNFLEYRYKDSEIWNDKYKRLYESLSYLENGLSEYRYKKPLTLDNFSQEQIDYILEQYRLAHGYLFIYNECC